jgi:translation initiation factor 2 subunit 2
MDEYERLLKRGLDKVPKDVEGSGRFHIAKPQLEEAGAKTIITNFLEIASSLRRDPDTMFKFLLQQLATKGSLEGQRATIQGVFTQEQVARKIDLYMNMYILCPECGKHDTKIVHEKGRELIKCEACGHKSPPGKKPG